MTSPKPRYPARVFHLLGRYRRHECQRCGAPILPKLRGRGLESPENLAKRALCDGSHHTAPDAPEPEEEAHMTPEKRAELIEALKGACEQHPDLLRYLGTDNPLTSQAEALELGRARA
jgi:DNA-directed RNA polymerase subunit RPC12/RpoP